MSGVVYASLGDIGDALVILDASRRVYVAASRDGSYLHVVSPSLVEAIDVDGNVIRPAGSLECRCRGFVFHGHCYRADQADAFEAGEADRAAAPAWMRDAAPGELVEAYGK